MPPPMPGQGRSSSWQERLVDYLRQAHMMLPVYNIVSDRRGGRTAWSATVTVGVPNSPTSQQTVQARFWYDGQYVSNAKEDAAEVALRMLTGGGASAAATSAGGGSPSSPTGSTSTTASFGSGGGGPNGAGSGSGAGGPPNAGVAWPRTPSQPGPWS